MGIHNSLPKSKKQKTIKIAAICFWIYLGLSLLFMLRDIFLTPDWPQVASQYSQLQIIIECVIYIIGGVVIKNLPAILIYLGIHLGIKRFKKDKLSEIDFKKYKDYYRDVLKNYSPAELSYIDKFEILPKNDIAASLLSLELSKVICLGDKIQITGCSAENISNSEKYILENIKDGKVTNINDAEFIEKTKADATKNGLLKESKIEWRKFAKLLTIAILVIVLMIFLCITIITDFINSPSIEEWKLFVLMIAMLLILYLPISIGVYFNTYVVKMKNNSYIRTKKGEELNEHLEGLKNYLKDFSNIHEKDEQSLAIWEDYLIYSVIFNQNTQALKSICDKYISL